MFKVYITKNKLEDIFIEESSTNIHSDWYKVLREQTDIGLDYYNQDEELDMSSPLFILLGSNPNWHFSDESNAINDITNVDSSKVLEYNPCGAYILDITEDEATEIRERYGVICESTDKLNETFLTAPIFTIDKGNKNGETWERLSGIGDKVPSNTLIIQDRYFCRSEHTESIQDTYDNYDQILRNLLPKSFSGEYHVMVIFDSKQIEKRDQQNFTDIAKQFDYIKSQIESERSYSIRLEVLSIPDHSYNHKLTHNRRILSNYYWIYAQHKLKAFRGSQPLATQSLDCKFLYSSESMPSNFIFENEESDSTADNHKNWIKDFQDIIDASKLTGTYNNYNPKKGNFPPVVYDFCVNGVKESPANIKNRILK